MPRPRCRLIVIAAVPCCAVVSAAWSVAADRPRRAPSPDAVRAVVAAMNAIVESDVPVDAAESTTCALEHLPGSRAALMPLVPGAHRRLIDECARGRMRVRRLEEFDPLAMIDEPADRPAAAAVVRGFFAGRAVDVVTGKGLSDGPYPIAFDWVVVLDTRSETLFSFVLNCRD